MMVINKMKKILKNKKAFTLIEIIGVLVIIGVLSIILIPVINNVLKENREKVYQSQLQNITLAAKNFGSDNMFILPEIEGDSIVVTIGQLKKSGYLEERIINPKTKKEFSNCTRIEIKKVNNNYEYKLDENTIDPKNCNEDFNSDIVISGPSKQYIKNGETSSYILIISPSEEEQILSYNFDDDKLSLGEETEAKYTVVGENGIYKIVILGGTKEEEITLVFEEGAITDSVGNKIDTSKLSPSTIIVDNTVPTITFGTNGNSNWSKKASSTINVNDEGSSGDTTTYKYIYSTSNSATPTTTFTSGSSYSQETGDGDYYLIATACDRSGNCTTEISNVFKLDNTAPSCDWSGESETWTNSNRTITVSGNDSGSGMKSDQSSNSWIYSSGTTKTADLEYTVSDSVGNTNNCSKTANVYVDKEAPSCNWSGESTTWTNSNRTITVSGNDSGSGMKSGQSSNTWTYSSGTTQTANLGYTVSDNAGNTNNCSKTANVYVDKNAPSIGDPNMVKGWFANGSQKRQFNIPITESGSGIDGQPSISYYHSVQVQGSWSDSTLYWVKDSDSEHWYQAGFGYDSSTTNILSITVTTKDVAGNTSSRSFSCNYGTNTCS